MPLTDRSTDLFHTCVPFSELPSNISTMSYPLHCHKNNVKLRKQRWVLWRKEILGLDISYTDFQSHFIFYRTAWKAGHFIDRTFWTFNYRQIFFFFDISYLRSFPAIYISCTCHFIVVTFDRHFLKMKFHTLFHRQKISYARHFSYKAFNLYKKIW